MGLREKPRLDMPGQLQFLACAVFGFRPFGMDAALCFDFAIDGVITQKRKGVSVRVFEGGGNSAPELHLRRMVKTHPAAAPFLELGENVFGQEDDLRGAADKLVFSGTGFFADWGKHNSAVAV